MQRLPWVIYHFHVKEISYTEVEQLSVYCSMVLLTSLTVQTSIWL